MHLIVALGASNTEGYGVDADAAFPAVLERLLRTRGLVVCVLNAGISGNTTGLMLARLDTAVPDGTKVVIFQPGSIDARLGIAEAVRERNIAEITRRLTTRGIVVIRVAAAFAAAREGNLQADGVHFTPAGYRRIAELLVEPVAAALVARRAKIAASPGRPSILARHKGH